MLIDCGLPSAECACRFTLVVQVVLLNLLIAIMGDTWQRVKDTADEEWKFLLVQECAPPSNPVRVSHTDF